MSVLDNDVFDLIKGGHILDARRLQESKPRVNSFLGSDKVQGLFDFQNGFGPHNAFDECGTNWKKYFFTRDALWNIQDDVVFSIMDRYTCKMGCQVCYLKKYWMPDGIYQNYISNDITEQEEAEILKSFTYFKRPNAIDDLKLLRDCYPKLFDFYKRNSHLMEFNITDNGFFSQFDILMNDVHFSKIAYLSFSDKLLLKKDNLIANKIKPMIKQLNERSPIQKINFIVTTGFVTENNTIMDLFEWIINNINCDVYFHTDLCQDKDYVADMKVLYNYDLPSIYYQENDVDPPIICQILTETIHMRKTQCFSTLTGSTVENTDPFYTFNSKFDPSEFLIGVLKGKLKTYDFYAKSIRKRQNNRFFDYFTWCTENVIVNDNYTFIPSSIIPVMSSMYQKLMTENYIDTNVGLLRKNSTDVIPIVEVKR